MELNKKYIAKLISLYENGESSLEQERELKTYFSSGDYDKEFEEYAMLFKFFESEAETNYDEEVVIPNTRSNFSWINIAASICIVVGGLWFYNYYSQQQELEEAKIAFEKTQDALNLLSHNMNQGLEKLEYVEVFSQKTNKILK